MWQSQLVFWFIVESAGTESKIYREDILVHDQKQELIEVPATLVGIEFKWESLASNET